MLRSFVMMFILCSSLVLCLQAQACDAGKKLTRGVVNIVTAPLEIPKQARLYWKEGAKKTPHILVWIFSGAVRGGVDTVRRVSSVVWDVVTFPVKNSKDSQPMVKPDYVFQDCENLWNAK